MKLLSKTLLLVLFIAILVAGCGGADDGTSSAGGVTVSSSSLSKDEFIEKATKLCRKARQNMLARVVSYSKHHESGKSTRSAETALFATTTKAILLPTIRKEIVEIRKLGAPEGDEEAVGAFLTAEQEAVDSVARVKHLVSRFEVERYFTESAKLAKEYGLDGCANE